VKTERRLSKFQNRIIDIRSTDFYVRTVDGFKDFGWSESKVDEYAINFIVSLLFDNMKITKKGNNRSYFLSLMEVWKFTGLIDCTSISLKYATPLQIQRFEEFIYEKFEGLK